MTAPKIAHLMDGFAPSETRVRAVCSCGYVTTPRATDARALAALLDQHELTPPVCALCDHDYTGRSWQQIRTALRILTDALDGQFLACRDVPRACRDGYAQKQMHLDRAARDGLGMPHPAPDLRVLPGGAG